MKNTRLIAAVSAPVFAAVLASSSFALNAFTGNAPRPFRNLGDGEQLPADDSGALPGNVPQCADPDAKLITTLYKDLLGRLASHQEAMAQAAAAEGHQIPRSGYARFIVNSAEFRRRQAGFAYAKMLGRDGDPAGLAYWSQYDLKTIYFHMAIAPEFTGAVPPHGDDVALRAWRTAWINKLYERLFNRTPDADEVKGWRSRMAAGISKEEVALAFVSSHEQHRNLVEGMYNDMLLRKSEMRGFNFWVRKLDTDRTFSFEEMAALFGGAPEYIDKALSVRTDVCDPNRRVSVGSGN